MPQPGDQYRGIANPFEDAKPRISEWTAQEIATLQSRLDKQLGPEFIASRKGPNGRQLHYLPAEKAINLANEVFGFNGWSSSIQNVQIDFCDINSAGKVNLGLSVIIRVTLKDGAYHEDIGYGHIENCTGKAAAFEKAKKEAATDALKRALRTFGNVLGNCLYDKNYESKISKMKVVPSKWNPDSLHRHPDYAVPKMEKPESDVTAPQPALEQRPRIASENTALSNGAEAEDEFGSNLFEGMDFDRADDNDDSAYESMLVDAAGTKPEPPGPPQQRPVPRIQSMPAIRPNNSAQQSAPQQRPVVNGRPPSATNMGAPPRPDAPIQRAPSSHANAQQPARHQQQTQPQQATAPQVQAAKAPQQRAPTPPVVTSETLAPDSSNQPQPPSDAPIRFITGRAAELLQKAEASHVKPNLPAFNPHAESPSLRRTSGINHNTSAPISRLSISANQNTSSGAPNGNAAAPSGDRPNFVNPQTDINRRIGMPGAAQSPLSNRSTYKPPGLKRPAEPVPRPALTDVSNVKNDGAADGADSKKPRLSSG